MCYPWKVIGFERWKNDKGEGRVRLYVSRDFSPEDGAGVETQRIYFNPQYVKYDPVLEDLIVVSEGKFGVSQITIVSRVSAS